MLSNKTGLKNYNTKSIDCDNNIEENKKIENETKCHNNKKPYLRRGAGLARYGLKMEEIKKKTGKLKFHKPVKSVPSKIKVPRKCLNLVGMNPKTEFGKLNFFFFLFPI